MPKARMSVEEEDDEIIEEIISRQEKLAEKKQVEENEEKQEQAQRKQLGKGELSKLYLIEAALFIANKPMSFQEICSTCKLEESEVKELVELLKSEYEARGGAIEVVLDNSSAGLQVKPLYLPVASKLSKELELSRKALKILALVAKKKGMLQKELKNYFKGEIYAYVTELKSREYITGERRGNTRLLKPTKKFFESFQVSDATQL